jgi:hypothetical protein
MRSRSALSWVFLHATLRVLPLLKVCLSSAKHFSTSAIATGGGNFETPKNLLGNVMFADVVGLLCHIISFFF